MRSRSAAAEEEHQTLIDPTIREFLMRYGRTTTPRIPDLRRAEEYVLTKVTRSTLMEYTSAFIVITCWRLRLGQPELAQAAINGAAAVLREHERWYPMDGRRRLEAMLRRLQNQVRMAHGIFPLFPWDVKDFVDEMAVPLTDLPHLVLTYCVLAYRFGAKAEALAMAEELRRVIERGEEDGDDVLRLHMEAWILANKALLHPKHDGAGQSLKQHHAWPSP